MQLLINYFAQYFRLGPTMPFIDYIQSTYKSSKKIYVNVEREFADEAKQYFSIHIQDIWHKSLLVVVAQDPVEYYMFPSGRNMAGRDPSLTTKSCVEAGNRIIAIPFSEAFTPAHLNDAVKREISLNDVMKRYDINVDSGSLGGFVQDSSGRIYALTARHVVKGKIKYNVIETTSRVHGTETGTIDIPTNDAMGSSNAMYNPEPVGAMGGLNLPGAMADLGNMQSPYYTIMPELSRRIGDMGTPRQGWLNGRDVEMQAPRCIGIAKNDNLAMSKGIVRPKSISLEVENNKFYGLNNNPKNNDKNPGIGIHPSTFLNPGVEPSSGRDAENLPLLTETLEEICDKNSHPDKKGKIYNLGTQYYGAQGATPPSSPVRKELDFALIEITNEIRKNRTKVNLCQRNKNRNKVALSLFTKENKEMYNTKVQKEGMATGITTGIILPLAIDCLTTTSLSPKEVVKCVDTFCIQSEQTAEPEPFSKGGDSGSLVTSVIDNQTHALAFGLCVRGMKKYTHFIDDKPTHYKNMSFCIRLDHCFEFADTEWGIKGLDFYSANHYEHEDSGIESGGL